MNPYSYTICRWLCKLFFKIFFRVKIYGAKYIPATGGFILAGNHVSYLDPVAVGIGCPRRVRFLAREDLFSITLLGSLLRSFGVIPLDREGRDIGAIKEAIRGIKKGQGVAIFPEGTRNASGGIGEMKLGVGFLAAKTQVPVIPVLVKGTDKAMPRGSKFIKPHCIEVYFRRPIMTSEVLGSNKEPRELYAEINKMILYGLTKFKME